MQSIRDTHGVPAKRGARVEYHGGLDPVTGTVTSADGQYLRVRLDGEKRSRRFHPAWKLLFIDGRDPSIRSQDVAAVLNALAERGTAELEAMQSDDLERYWQFAWEDSASLEWNLYTFHRALGLYGRFCRRWEEMHNSSCCVVERVRDTYLLPKINEFTAMMVR